MFLCPKLGIIKALSESIRAVVIGRTIIIRVCIPHGAEVPTQAVAASLAHM